jgi:hypothetical protein
VDIVHGLHFGSVSRYTGATYPSARGTTEGQQATETSLKQKRRAIGSMPPFDSSAVARASCPCPRYFTIWFMDRQRPALRMATSDAPHRPAHCAPERRMEWLVQPGGPGDPSARLRSSRPPTT